MKVAVDTNILVRAAIRDHPRQAAAADRVLTQASVVAVSCACLCEFVWVLRKLYGLTASDIGAAIRALMDAANVVVDRPAVEAGLMMLEAGGDFADGIIAHEGRWLGGETFVSFDRKAVARLTAQGEAARLP